MDDCHLVVRCQLSNLLHRPEGELFGQVSLFFLNFFNQIGKCNMFKNIYLFYKNDTPFTKVMCLYKYKYYILIKSKKFLEVKDSLEQNIFIKK